MSDEDVTQIAVISRRYTFAAAHQIKGHPKCGRLHGHNYVVIVEVTGSIKSDGMVMDFATLDMVVKPIIEGMDHRFLFSKDDGDNPIALVAKNQDMVFELSTQQSTAELLAGLIASYVLQRLSRSITAATVEVYETEKSMARVTVV